MAFDERLATSPIAEGFRARTHFADACAALHLEGELVQLEDLVLHDAAADVRTPSHALTRAHGVLRARRRITAATPGWAGTGQGLAALRGRAPVPPADRPAPPADAIAAEEGALDAELAAIDALIARSSRALAGRPAPSALAERGGAEGGERACRLERWIGGLADASSPPILAAAAAGEALDGLAPSPGEAWLGRLVVADLLRTRMKTRHHLAGVHLGQKLHARGGGGRSAPARQRWIGALATAARRGLADHDRWLTARHLLERRLVGRRSTSSLPALVDLVMRVPMVSAGTIAAGLRISPRAAGQLAGELGLREVTGQGRCRCWGVL